MTIAAVVLAAGSSRRFGGAQADSKLLAEFRGRPLVAWALDAALGAGLDAAAVVTGAVDLENAGVVPEGMDVVPNPRWAQGQATSLQTARSWADAAGHTVMVIGLGDQPLIDSGAWRAVADAAAAAGAGPGPADSAAANATDSAADSAADTPTGGAVGGSARIWVATYSGARRNPVALHRDVWPLLPTAGDEGARVTMRRRPDLVQEIPCPGVPADIDTREDLQRWS